MPSVFRHRKPRVYSLRFLLTSLLLAALVPVLMVRAGTYFRLLRSQYESSLSANLELARVAASMVDSYINDMAREELAIGTALAFLEPPTTPAASDFLAVNAAQYPPILRLHWVDTEGRIVNSSDPAYIGRDIINREHFRRAIRCDQWVLGDLIPSMIDNAPVFMIDRCIRNREGIPQGTVAAVVDPRRLESEIFKRGHTGDSRVMVIDRQRRIICSDPKFDLPWEKRIVSDTELVRKAFAGQEASGIATSALDGQQRAVAIVPIGQTGWVVVASHSLTKIMAPLRQDLLLTAAATIGVVIASLLLALMIRRQISRGVQSLQEHAVALAQGRLAHRAEIIGVAELQAVAEVFNQTAARRQQAEEQLRELNETLEQRVAERSAVAEQQAGQLRAMVVELSRAEERERRRLAQVLHDDLQQILAAGKFHAGALRAGLSDETLRQRLTTVIDLIDESINTSRSLAIELSPPVLNEGGLPAALVWLARWMEDKHGLHVDVQSDEGLSPPPENIRIFLFNAAKELLFNVTKHGGVKQARIELRRHGSDHVALIVQDQGAGFDPDRRQGPSPTGFGLFSIRERLALMGGRMQIESAPGAGTRITLIAPTSPPASEDARP